jgi:hypothetical protein
MLAGRDEIEDLVRGFVDVCGKCGMLFHGQRWEQKLKNSCDNKRNRLRDVKKVL